MSEAERKYGAKADFNDPVVRCDSCINIIFTKDLRENGMCPQCGNRKVREIRQLNHSEIDVLKGRGVDPDFIALFEPIGEKQ